MVFTSWQYLIFLSIILLSFLWTPQRFRWMHLIVASYFFYAMLLTPHLLVILITVTCAAYLVGLLIDRATTERKKKFWFVSGVSLQLLILVSVKYVPFFLPSLNALFNEIGLNLKFLVIGPWQTIGISYFIFQALSYQIDIYFELAVPEKHLGYFALYLSFFPKLLQGPLERVGEFLPQVRQKYVMDAENIMKGLSIFIIGAFEKVVIADRLAGIVNTVYDDLSAYRGLSLLVTSFLYALQIYYDFAGYTDMAIGSALLFNIKLTPNFKNPYYAVSISDFWRRWHISFSKWLLDYVFTPLQLYFRDKKQWGTAFAIFITFLICGMWHGANWTFIVWGALHGLYLGIAILIEPYQKHFSKMIGVQKMPGVMRVIQTLLTFTLISLTWIFFRATSLQQALVFLQRLLISPGRSSWSIVQTLQDLGRAGLNDYEIRIAVLAILFMEGIHLLREYPKGKQFFLRAPLWLRLVLFYFLILITGLLGRFNLPGFIYLQF
jgi:alginate O-acetyltransferase complex protein AlgI